MARALGLRYILVLSRKWLVTIELTQTGILTPRLFSSRADCCVALARDTFDLPAGAAHRYLY